MKFIHIIIKILKITVILKKVFEFIVEIYAIICSTSISTKIVSVLSSVIFLLCPAIWVIYKNSNTIDTRVENVVVENFVESNSYKEKSNNNDVDKINTKPTKPVNNPRRFTGNTINRENTDEIEQGENSLSIENKEIISELKSRIKNGNEEYKKAEEEISELKSEIKELEIKLNELSKRQFDK